MHAVTEKWKDRYPNAMKRWEDNWDVISPMFKFSADVRKDSHMKQIIGLQNLINSQPTTVTELDEVPSIT